MVETDNAAARTAGSHSREVTFAHPGARASRPPKARHSLSHLRHLNRPPTAPWLSFGLAVSVSAGMAAACKVVPMLSGRKKYKDAGGTPALPGGRQRPVSSFRPAYEENISKNPVLRQSCGLRESCEAAAQDGPGRQPGVVSIPRQPSRECGGIESSRIVHRRPALSITVCIVSILPVLPSDSARSHHPLQSTAIPHIMWEWMQ